MGNEIDGQYLKDRLTDILPNEMIWLDESGRVIYANETICKHLGYSTVEITGLSIYDICSQFTEATWDHLVKRLKKGKSYINKNICITRSGKHYQINAFFQLISHQGNPVISIIGDTSYEADFYKKLMENTAIMAHVGGWELNTANNVLTTTEEMFHIFKTDDLQSLSPENIHQYFKQSDLVKERFSRLRHEATSFDDIWETTETPQRYIRAIGKPILQGHNVYKILGIYQDVSEQQYRENSLRFHKEILDSTKDFIYVFDSAGNLSYYNGAVVKKNGYSKEQLDNFNIVDIDPAVTPQWWRNHIGEIKEKGVVDFEWQLQGADGNKVPAQIKASHLVYNGKDYNCSVIRDITERKMYEKKLLEALDEIKSLKEQLEYENIYLREEIDKTVNFGNIISTSESYKKVLQQVRQVAATDTTVLITGESGTGKELLANAIHHNSNRSERPLIKVNCATLPKELIESELFGHKKGAFTGAIGHKVGKFTLADGGTIFLDEIGEMPLSLQSKLLRVLQEGEFDELGGIRTTRVNVRVIAASNRNLEKMVRENTFRSDLYYRLNVFPIHSIPLRARKEDIPLLAQHFLEKYAARTGKYFKGLSSKAIDKLLSYNFPGNIRELENLIERAVIIEEGAILKPGSWMPETSDLGITDDFKSFEQLQKDYIVKVLTYTHWRVCGKDGAASILEMNPKTLFSKMKRLGIERKISLL